MKCRDKTRDDPTISRHLGEIPSHLLGRKDIADGSDTSAIVVRQNLKHPILSNYRSTMLCSVTDSLLTSCPGGCFLLLEQLR